jgi:hypothetical protein
MIGDMWGRFAIAGLVALVALGLFGFRHLDRIVLAAVAPRAPFDPATVPAPPRYGDDAAWSALPGRADAGAAEVATLARAAHADADVFYVHPTSYVGSAWNASLDDAAVNAATDAGATRIQATAFGGCCAVYAPRYRQANLTAFTDPSADGARAIRLAGDDVIAAFHFYVERYNGGRPFVLAGHSQGSILALRLLEEEIASTPLRDWLVAAYLIGSSLTEAEAASVLPICAAPAQTGCIAAFNARSDAYVPGIELQPIDGRLCVNPLTWRHDEASAPAAQNRGAVFWDGDATPSPRPGFASARCERGVLRVELHGTPPRDLPSRILDRAIGAGNYHPIEYGLFFVDLHDNAALRVAAFQASHAAR